MAEERPHPTLQSSFLRRESEALRQYADALCAEGNALIQDGRRLRERIRQFLSPPPPTSTA
jgi:hypothetical protein